MTRILFLVICLVIQSFSTSNSVELECAYEKVNYEESIFYRCENKNTLNLISRKRTLIDKLTGTHEDDMTDDNVVDFYSDTKNIQYFPQGLSKIFKNLKRVIINSNGIRDLSQSDLKDYPKLEVLILDNNLIEVLHDDLFKYNPDLTWISMESNFITQIYPRVFDGLNKLDNLELTSNYCINMKASNDSTAIQNIIRVAKVECSNAEFLEIEEEIKKLEDNVHNLNDNNVLEFNVKCQKLYLKLDNFAIADSVYLNTRLGKVQTVVDVFISEFYKDMFHKIANLEKKIVT
ncbi:hypothetical protein ACKWTF_010483 [Chironomus riparius]